MQSAQKALTFAKNWMLPISIVIGISSYLIYHNTPALYPAGPFFHELITKGQAVLISALLFLQFLKVSPHDMKLHRWHLIILTIQVSMSALFAGLATINPGSGASILFECAMICFICPTASAAAVITGRLGGSAASCMTFNVLTNACATIIIPTAISVIHPSASISFAGTAAAIAARIFPVLLLPCILAWTIRLTLPKFHDALAKYSHWSFYIWGLALIIAMILSTRALLLSNLPAGIIAGIVAISIASCALQFIAGRMTGARYGEEERITAGQALGQKNTGFIIWIGYSFMTPVTSVAGGLYAIWQNLFNSWELKQSRRAAAISSKKGR